MPSASPFLARACTVLEVARPAACRRSGVEKLDLRAAARGAAARGAAARLAWQLVGRGAVARGPR